MRLPLPLMVPPPVPLEVPAWSPTDAGGRVERPQRVRVATARTATTTRSHTGQPQEFP